MFAFGLPLIFEQKLPSSRFSSSYVATFFSGLAFYFFTLGVLSALAFVFAKNMSVESKIVISTFLAVFLGTPGFFATISSYYGNHLDRFWIIAFWIDLEPGRSGYIIFLAIFFLFLVSTAISIIAIASYKVFGILRKRKENTPKSSDAKYFNV